MARYLIIGCGRFGRLAWQRLQERDGQAVFRIVDRDPGKLALLPTAPHTDKVAADGIQTLLAALAPPPWPDWIIPAVPVHVAYLWLLETLLHGDARQPAPLPPGWGEELPFCQRGPAGEVYLSLATQRCPDDCPEPAARCQLTGLPRQINLFDYLAQHRLPGWETLVLRSRQLAPGVGGCRPADLLDLRQRVLAAPGEVIICTACRCHGVCHGLQKPASKEAGVGF